MGRQSWGRVWAPRAWSARPVADHAAAAALASCQIRCVRGRRSWLRRVGLDERPALALPGRRRVGGALGFGPRRDRGLFPAGFLRNVRKLEIVRKNLN